MNQDFKLQSLLPSDSYLHHYFNVTQAYSERSIGPNVYFRNVDQSDVEVQNQMIDYIDELSKVKCFGAEAPFCWITDFRKILQESNNSALNECHLMIRLISYCKTQ